DEAADRAAVEMMSEAGEQRPLATVRATFLQAPCKRSSDHDRVLTERLDLPGDSVTDQIVPDLVGVPVIALHVYAPERLDGEIHDGAVRVRHLDAAHMGNVQPFPFTTRTAVGVDVEHRFGCR